MKFDRKVGIAIHPEKGLILDSNGTLAPDPEKVLDKVIATLKEHGVAGVHKYSCWIPGISDHVETHVPLEMIEDARADGFTAYLQLAKFGKPKLVISDPGSKPKRQSKIIRIA